MKLLKQMPSENKGFMSRQDAAKLYSKISGISIKKFNWIYNYLFLN